MPFCPECGTEYREGFTLCADCGVALGDHPTEQPVAKPIDWALLTHAGTLEADGLISLLGFYDIASRRKAGDGDISKLYTGISSLGEDIYVPSEEIERAREIISSRNELPGDAEIEGMENSELEGYSPPGESYEKRRRRIGLFLTLVWVIPLAIYALLRFYNNIRGRFG